MITLFSALFLLKHNFNIETLILQILIVLTGAYFSYFEYITNKARRVYRDRIYLIENALKSEVFLNKIKVFDIGQISSEIKFQKDFFKSKEFFTIILIGIVLVVLLSFNKNSNNDNKKSDSIYNYNYRAKEASIDYNNIIEEIKENNRLLINNNAYLNDFNIYCSENKIEK